MADKFEHMYVETNGIHLHVVQAGPDGARADAPLVVLLHGFPESWRSWEAQIEPLTQAGFTVWVPDQRGYNLSDKPPGVEAYRLDAVLADLVGLARASGRERVSLVGHDWGGIVAWMMAAHYPERVERLAVLNAPYPAVAASSVLKDPSQLLRSAYVFFFQLPGLPEAMLRNENWKLLVDALRRTSQPGTFSDEKIEAYRQGWWKRNAMTSMLNWYRALLRFPPRQPADPRIRVPVLGIWGSKDAALGREMARQSFNLCDDCQLIIFDEATHWIQHEEAEQVNALLLNFLGAERA